MKIKEKLYMPIKSKYIDNKRKDEYLIDRKGKPKVYKSIETLKLYNKSGYDYILEYEVAGIVIK